jgi:hypothetical protein
MRERWSAGSTRAVCVPPRRPEYASSKLRAARASEPKPVVERAVSRDMNSTVSSVLVLVLLCACTSAPSKYLEPVPFHATTSFFDNGDQIRIDSVSAQGGSFSPGAEIEVRGRYRLASRQRARLCFGLTHGDLAGDNWLEVERGNGDFALSARLITPGDPHVALYSSDTAYNCIANQAFVVDLPRR